ncbi:Hydantoinase B/oxoprolinase-domain-containing protein [Colletotrichum phormii]|uniref:Hydantoinase B/oxoprolinase-domain-containing protein n=1 Tax=Colletotrichum phormii TaxID=359342 RepID=A0AAI9ZUS7_9PEZI|nr:Hydantoinase B/oxoprolinase-domain-containing protein [Colletotrichum phormii]KAK1638592.1 Hydantoinase B/oxoprolinase-domain-containing protein [Colletotrichum phormii]
MAKESASSNIQPKSVKFAIDRGGTFTDVWASIPGQSDVVLKLLSVDPGNYDDAPAEGIRRVLEMVSGTAIPRRSPIPKDLIRSIRMGTTVATNALLERKGTRHAFVVNQGFRDLLDIGYQSRPKLFDLGIRKPELLYDEVVEISERLTVEAYDENAFKSSRTQPKESPGLFVRGVTGDLLRVVRPLDEDEVRQKLLDVKSKGIETLAICLAHSYMYPAHESRVAKIASDLGFGHISTSSSVGANMIKMISRGSSASADAYLTPEIVQYVEGFAKQFQNGNLDDISCEFMQSDGGLVSHKAFSGLRGILSGPAGGVVGHARTSYDGKSPIVGFDMGGTSTDVSRYGGSLEHVFESTTAGVSIQSPQLDINTVAAGGGSMLFWRDGLFKVGPESAGAHPGPASYRKSGPLTVTDANLFLHHSLGRLIPSYFPAIFGPDENLPLDSDIVAKKFEELTNKINADTGRSMTPHEVAIGFIDVANESMCRPIRALTEARGFVTADHNLATFGGAGGQHACEIAEKLGIGRIVIHKYSSILSAYGMALAEVVQEAQEPSSEMLAEESLPRLNDRLSFLKEKATGGLLAQNIEQSAIEHESYLNLRYNGTDTNFMILEPDDGDWLAALEREHLRELSFTFPRTRKVHVDDIRVRGVGKADESSSDNARLVEELKSLSFKSALKVENDLTDAFFTMGGLQSTKIIQLSCLQPGAVIMGPAIVIDNTQTIVVVPGAEAKILTSHVVIDLVEKASKSHAVQTNEMVVDPVKLSIFGHRFMSIAEQMGRTLQKTSISLNIKERLDFSCAIFSPVGDLVANAPHVPVHLGSMSYAVKYQHELHRGSLRPGDVLVSNHPEAGGTHLPDITVITPVFDEDGKTICFYTASRGHHLDIGGSKGNSMPPDSTELWQEGAAIKSFFLIRDGNFDEEGIVKILLDPGLFPGCSGSRRLPDNLSDLKAQVAANTKGSVLIKALMEEFGRSVVHFYMAKIQENAEVSVRRYLSSAYMRFGSKPLKAVDYLDNGSRMQVSITIDEGGFGTFDFTGTSCEMLSNMNAPPAITYSALIYTLRLLIGSDIPLNQGCLAPTKVILPKNTFLNPGPQSAVCCGNTLTSQRLVDLLLKAFRAAAGSQGCMNCFGFFGNSVDPAASSENPKDDNSEGFGFGYGETICGGEGAGPTWHGASGVQIHMTNTRTTDIEIIEKRYPVLIREFSIRKDSGGDGKFRGGCGIVRDFECRAPLTYGIISERRVHQPYGMMGGENGESGANYWVQKTDDGDERWISIGPRGQVDMKTGDRCVIHTPGGGGWGIPDELGLRDDGVNGTDGPWTGQTVYPRATGSLHAFAAAQEASS